MNKITSKFAFILMLAGIAFISFSQQAFAYDFFDYDHQAADYFYSEEEIEKEKVKNLLTDEEINDIFGLSENNLLLEGFVDIKAITNSEDIALTVRVEGTDLNCTLDIGNGFESELKLPAGEHTMIVSGRRGEEEIDCGIEPVKITVPEAGTSKVELSVTETKTINTDNQTVEISKDIISSGMLIIIAVALVTVVIVTVFIKRRK